MISISCSLNVFTTDEKEINLSSVGYIGLIYFTFAMCVDGILGKTKNHGKKPETSLFKGVNDDSSTDSDSNASFDCYNKVYQNDFNNSFEDFSNDEECQNTNITKNDPYSNIKPKFFPGKTLTAFYEQYNPNGKQFDQVLAQVAKANTVKQINRPNKLVPN